jgi:DNA-binding NarL/FixJ family response regulator
MRLGHKGSAMADLLGITQSTIEKYTEMLYLKLNVHCAGQAVAAGYDLGLLTSGMTVQDALKLPNKK